MVRKQFNFSRHHMSSAPWCKATSFIIFRSGNGAAGASKESQHQRFRRRLSANGASLCLLQAGLCYCRILWQNGVIYHLSTDSERECCTMCTAYIQIGHGAFDTSLSVLLLEPLVLAHRWPLSLGCLSSGSSHILDALDGNWGRKT